MKWISHLAIAAAVCAVFNPAAVPAAVLGSTAPDWLEMVINAGRSGRRMKHRGVTHYFVAWALLALFAALVWDWRGWLYWFAIGGAIHWICDALTVSGAPFSWWSDRRMTLFGGKVMTGSAAEFVITGVVVGVCALLIWSRHSAGGFIPYFLDWRGFYENGNIDGFEWRTNRWNIV